MMYGSIFMEIEWQLYDPFKKELLGICKKLKVQQKLRCLLMRDI
jgi:hypothetical protein